MREINRKILQETYIPVDYRDMRAAYICRDPEV